MGTLRRIVNAESKLLGRVGSCGCHKINADVSVIAKIVTPVDVDSHIEGACGKRLLVAWISEMAKEYRFQFIAVSVAVHLLVLYELSHFRLFLSIELIYLTSCLSFRLADYSLVNQKSQHCAYLMLDGSLACVHFGHEKRNYIVYCGQEGRFVYIREVAYHKEHIYNSTIKFLFFWVCNVFKSLTCIGNGTLTKMLHGTLEHGTKEAVERDKLSDFHISGFLSYGEGDVDK